MPTTLVQLTDATLLRQYAETKNPAVFHELATRHLDWIYSTALRLTRSPAHAEDVTQSVLLALSEKAHALQHHRALISWLFRATRYSAATLVRAERRRKKHEAAAMPTSTAVDPLNTDWLDIQPRLDTAVAKLSRGDRQAILLRFYQQRTHADIAAALNISEEAARKRSERALQRLRHILRLNMSSTSLGTLLTTTLQSSSPAHLTVASLMSHPAPHVLAASKTIFGATVRAKCLLASGVLAMIGSISFAFMRMRTIRACPACATVPLLRAATFPANNPTAMRPTAWTVPSLLAALERRETRLKTMSFHSVESRYTIDADDKLLPRATRTLDVKIRNDDFRITSSMTDSRESKHSAVTFDNAIVGDTWMILQPWTYVISYPRRPDQNILTIGSRIQRHRLLDEGVFTLLGINEGSNDMAFSQWIDHCIHLKNTTFALAEQMQDGENCLVLTVIPGANAPEDIRIVYSLVHDLVLKQFALHPFNRHDGSMSWDFDDWHITGVAQVDSLWLPTQATETGGREDANTHDMTGGTETTWKLSNISLAAPTDADLQITLPPNIRIIDHRSRTSYIVKAGGSHVSAPFPDDQGRLPQ